MAGHKGQHWVPRSYLEPWCDPDTPKGQDSYVWLFSKDGTTAKRKAPHNIFKETDLYTIHLEDGTRNLAIEHGLSGLESRFCQVRDRKIAKMLPLDNEDRMVLCAFTAAMFLRTPAIRDHWQAQWKKVHEIGEQMMQVVEQTPPEERDRLATSSFTDDEEDEGESLSHEQVKDLMDEPLQQMLIPLVPSQSRWFLAMSLVVLRAVDDIGFITSDSPCVWFDPKAFKRPFPFNQPGLGYKTVEVTLPVSPDSALLFSWSDVRGYADVKEPMGLDEINWRTRFHCHEQFVVRRHVTRTSWLDARTWREPSTDPPTTGPD